MESVLKSLDITWHLFQHSDSGVGQKPGSLVNTQKTFEIEWYHPQKGTHATLRSQKKSKKTTKTTNNNN